MSSAGEPAVPGDLARAVASVDRELAGSIELVTMFWQTRQAATLENDGFARARGALATALPADLLAELERLYAAIPLVEAAMLRRGPANTFPDAERVIVETWEGDVRLAQRMLREALAPAPAPSALAPSGLWARLRRLFGRG